MHPSNILSIEMVVGSGSATIITAQGDRLQVPDDLNNRHTQIAEEWFALGNSPTIVDLPPVDTIEDVIANLPPLWKAALDAYIEQQPRNKQAVINNIKRHLK